jgi:hypothetical protein
MLASASEYFKILLRTDEREHVELFEKVLSPVTYRHTLNCK